MSILPLAVAGGIGYLIGKRPKSYRHYRSNIPSTIDNIICQKLNLLFLGSETQKPNRPKPYYSSLPSNIVRRGSFGDDIMFKTREDAEKVINELNYCINMYGKASIDDFYRAAGTIIKPRRYTITHGWYSIGSPRVFMHYRGQFMHYHGQWAITGLPEPVDFNAVGYNTFPKTYTEVNNDNEEDEDDDESETDC